MMYLNSILILYTHYQLVYKNTCWKES